MATTGLMHVRPFTAHWVVRAIYTPRIRRPSRSPQVQPVRATRNQCIQGSLDRLYLFWSACLAGHIAGLACGMARAACLEGATGTLTCIKSRADCPPQANQSRYIAWRSTHRELR